MEAKALFLDLDGTLLNDRKEITASNRAAIYRALDMGHKVVINTGRPLVSAIKQGEALGLTGEGCYLIAYNGSVIYDMYQRKILFQRTLPLEFVREVFAEANRRGIHIQTYDDTHTLVEPRNDNTSVRRYCDIIKMDFRVIPDVNGLTQEPVKMLLIDFNDHAPLEEFRQWLLRNYADRMDTFFSCEQYLEIVTKGLSKGSALLQLCDILGVPAEHSIAAGDAPNDLDMLRTAAVGVAMANATDEVKAVSDYITRRDNNHDGIAEIVEKFVL